MLGIVRVTGLIVLAIGLLAGPGWAQAPIEIKIGAATATDHAPGFIGVEKGIFAKHGLDAKVVMYQTGVEMINGSWPGRRTST